MRPVKRTAGPSAALRIITLAALTAACAFYSPSTNAAKISVKGFGLFGNAELKNALQLLEIGNEPIDSQKIDDGAFLLLTRLTQNGFLEAKIEGEYQTTDGDIGNVIWTIPFEPQLSENVSAEKIQFKTIPGTLYHYNSVSIEGLQSIDPEIAQTYIIPDSSLISRKKDRAYSESTLSNHQKQLAAGLAALGRIDAKVTTTSLNIDKTTGGVDIALNVAEGPLYKVAKAEVHYLKGEEKREESINTGDATYTRRWLEDQAKNLRNESYHLGYPDTKVSSRIVSAMPEGGTVAVHIRFDVTRGPLITLSGIEHRGADDTHHPLLNRKTDLETNKPLDITKTEAARRRLSRIGIFQRIDLEYEQDGAGQRKAVYNYQNSDRIQAQLLFGYGSYEQLRAGFLARRENLFGRAHTLSFSAIRSIKSTSGQIDYTVPELLGESISGTMELNFLDRQELNFDRNEQGISLGLFKSMPKIGTDIGLDYALERKESSDIKLGEELELEEANIGSLLLRATKSKIDSLLYPKSGYIISGAIQYANESLGGTAEFIRPEFSLAYHKKLGNRWLFHCGIKGGQITFPEANDSRTPLTEDFLIGGENSVRGYRRGEATPIDANGTPTSVEAFGQFNVELEYPIFNQLNIVLFADAARVWESAENRDSYADFTSIGLGLRYNTIVGPVRLEYGHNLDPRPSEPKGTVHLSIGFPF